MMVDDFVVREFRLLPINQANRLCKKQDWFVVSTDIELKKVLLARVEFPSVPKGEGREFV